MTEEDILIDTFCARLADRVRFANTLAKPEPRFELLSAYAKTFAVGFVGLAGLASIIISLGSGFQ